ncbi:MAG: tetratricopeptide repeat protein, partial [Firmicutes bacterium]|nr:tetratricopeptide repeat protein [Bacillota bacterium]
METPISLNQIGLYNPQRQSDGVTEKLFVVRQKQFELLLNKIVQEKKNSIPQHYLIIGQRGMGKSTILKRMEVELRKAHSQQFIPLLFPEEQNNIRNLAEFWLNNLMVLIKSLKLESHSNEKKLADILKTKNELSKEMPEIIAEEAYKYLMGICRELRRRPVLFIDNIGFVFSRLENKQEQWALRKLLSENGAPIVVSAGVTVTDEIVKYDMPFYDFFQIQYLKKLSYEEFEILLENLAKVTNSDKIVFTSIRENISRQRSLFDLTGGSPRTTVMLFKHITKGFSSDINDDLEILADEITPLYKAKFEELPKQQQIIIDAIAMNWHAISLNKLSKRTRYANNQLSQPLKRLIDEGWIETVTAEKSSREILRETEGIIKGNAYFISERFFNIWYLLRYDILKEGIYCLSKFLECFYGKEELEKMSDNLLKQDIGSAKQMRLHLAMSKSEILDPQKRKKMEDNISKVFMEKEELRKEFGVSEDAVLESFLSFDIGTVKNLTTKKELKNTEFWSDLGYSLRNNKQYEKAVICYNKSIEINPNNEDSWYWKGYCLYNMRQYDKANICFAETVNLEPNDGYNWLWKGYALNNLQQFDEAINCLDKAIELNPNLHEVSVLKEKSYALRMIHQFVKVVDCLDEAIKLNSNDDVLWNHKGNALIELKKYKEAALAFEKSKLITPKDLLNKFHLTFLYRDKLDKMNKAIEVFNEIEHEIKNDENKKFVSRYYLNKTLFELHNQNKGLAKEYLQQAFGVLEEENKISSMANEYWWMRFGGVVIDLGYGSWLLAIL